MRNCVGAWDCVGAVRFCFLLRQQVAQRLQVVVPGAACVQLSAPHGQLMKPLMYLRASPTSSRHVFPTLNPNPHPKSHAQVTHEQVTHGALTLLGKPSMYLRASSTSSRQVVLTLSTFSISLNLVSTAWGQQGSRKSGCERHY